VEKILITNCGN